MTVLELEKLVNRDYSQPHVRGTSAEDFNLRLFKNLTGREEVTGSELMVKALESLAPENPGIHTIAGHHGGAILPFFEYFTKSLLYVGYTHAPHEQIAGHMAEGVASTGVVGVAIGTSGPGATNLVTAFYDAYMCSRPVVMLTGNVATTVAGSMAFQEAPIIPMISPVAKEKYYVTDARDLAWVIYDAFRIALNGRPGPVWIDVPKDVQLNKISISEVKLALKNEYSPNGNLADLVSGFHELANRIKMSKKILLYVGGGAKDAAEEIRQFAYRHGIPVTTTIKGKGIFPETHPLSLGMLGMHGTAYANIAADEADLIISVGARFDDRVTGNPREFAKNAYIAHIDVDPRGIGPQKEINGASPRKPNLVINSDARKAVMLLDELVDTSPNLREWHERTMQLKAEYPLDYEGRHQLHEPKNFIKKMRHRLRATFPFSRFTKPDAIKPEYIIEKIFELTKGECSVVTGVGQHQMWAAQYYKSTDPFGFDTSGGAGTMGYAGPAAIGQSKILRHLGKSNRIAVIDGDESLRMTPQSFELYTESGADVMYFVIDNKAADGTPGGMVRQWYKTVHKDTQYPVKDRPDIVDLALGYGIKGESVSYLSQVEPAINRALRHKGPYLVRFKVDPFEDCLPMIPGGKTVRDMKTFQDTT